MINKFYSEENYFNLNFDIELEKDKNIYCFIGENGVGKTKLLESLCTALIYSHEIFNRSNGNTKMNNIFISKELKESQIRIPLKIKINNENLRNDNPEWGVTSIDEIPKHPPKITEKFKIPFAYIATKDRGYGLNIENGNVKLVGNKLERFQENFLKTLKFLKREKVNDSTVAEWFVSRIVSLNNPLIIDNEKIVKELKLLCLILKDLEPVKLKSLISEDTNSISIFIKEGQLYFNGIPFESLSTGYMSIVKIFQEIIDTYGSWDFENIGDYNSKAVFFIDELEAHLHPRWENKFIPLLKKHFSNAVFYIATHSPIVLSSIEEGEAYELVKEDIWVKAKKLGNPKNWYLADVYSQAFHLDDFFDIREEEKEKTRDRFQEFSDMVKSYMKVKDSSLKEKIDNLYKEIFENLSEDDPRKITLMNLYKLVR